MDQETLQTSVTVILIIAIAGAAYYYFKKAKQLNELSDILKKGSSDPLQRIFNLKLEKLTEIASDYRNTINVKMPDGMKTSCPSEEYFSADAVSWSAGINLRILNAAAGGLVGLGLLGTFIGLLVGMRSFDLKDSETILANLSQLTSGMWMAFLTSIVGMICSIFFSHYYKHVSAGFRMQLREITKKLDWAYYVDDANLFAEVLREQLEHVQDPVSSLVREVVADLKTVMNGMISDFKAEVAGAARAEFETLTERLRDAAGAMADFPANLQKVSEGLPGMIESVTSANEEAVKKADGLAAGLAEREKELDDLRTKAATRIKAVLGGLDQSIGKLAEASTAIAGSADLLVKAQGGMTETASDIRGASGEMRASLDSFRTAQQDFSANMGKIQQAGGDNIRELSSLLDESRSLTEDSAREFGTIKDGLKDVFGELQKDLTEYSETVRKSTQTFLDQYTDSLTKTASSLSDTVQRLTDTLGKGRK